jgi:hypothetical protein
MGVCYPGTGKMLAVLEAQAVLWVMMTKICFESSFHRVNVNKSCCPETKWLQVDESLEIDWLFSQ